MERKRRHLEEKLNELQHFNYPVQSRVHPLNSFGAGFFVKRDDELGFGISGCKFRKYRTLLPHIVNQRVSQVLVVGGAYSNHVLAITQLLLENGLEPILFLKGARPEITQGNFLFLELLVPAASMHWIPKEEWGQIDTITQRFAEKLERAFVIPEGAPLFECFLGALSLPLDILRNEEELGVTFQHICMEAGTGISAAALLLGLSFLEKSAHVHLLHVAEEEAAFLKTLQSLQAAFGAWLGCSVPFPSNYSALPTTLARSFGATNARLFECIKETARSEGFFLDPIYSAKLFHSVKEAEIAAGPTLLLHSGGALSLSGFQKSLHAAM